MKSVFLLVAFLTAACAQDRVTVPFSDPSRPRYVVLSMVNGGMNIRGYSGKEVIVEPHTRGSRNQNQSRRDGMRKIYSLEGGLTVEELDNTVKISPSASRTMDVDVQVPFETNLKLRGVNSGEIQVEGVRGEVDAQNVNGGIRVVNVSGAVLANSVNGRIFVTLDSVTSGKSMNFSTLNGNIDVTLPPDLKANLKMKTHNGDIYSDFAMTLQGMSPRSDKSMIGVVNGGGPEIQFTSFNGKIYIRKKK